MDMVTIIGVIAVFAGWVCGMVANHFFGSFSPAVGTPRSVLEDRIVKDEILANDILRLQAEIKQLKETQTPLDTGPHRKLELS